MIHVEKALAAAQYRTPKKQPPPELNDDEKTAFGYLDYQIESAILTNFNGNVFEIKITPDVLTGPNLSTENLIAAIKNTYEQGEWLVGVFPVPSADGASIAAVQFVFTPKVVGQAERRAPTELPTIIASTAPAVAVGTRILVRMPTRGRPAQAISVLAAYQSMAGMPIQLEVVVDNDDETITSEVLYRFHALGAHIVFGDHGSKIAACNDGRVKEWDVIVLGSDDMVPVKDGWAVRVAELFEEHFPFFDGCIWLDDSYAHDRVNTLSILGRRYYESRSSIIYNPSYRSVFCDDEHTETARALGRIVYVPEVLIEHRHPAAGKAELDALYVRNDAAWKLDEAVYKLRLASGFGLSPMKLSLLVCTYPDRRAMLDRFLDYLNAQINDDWSACGQVEIVIDDKPAASLGEKRQRVLNRAKGEYIAFVDDDDLVAPDYVKRVLKAIEMKSDCVSLVGIITTNGSRPERFEHSLKYQEWKTVDGVHQRFPNHLNPVRTEIARKVGFENMTYTEDFAYSKAILPYLKNESSSGDAPLYHYFYRSKPDWVGIVK